PSRFWVNRGGRQGGTPGVFTDETGARWGRLLSVPACDQVSGGDAGPFRAFAGDCEFADFDDDGDMDLFFGSCDPAPDAGGLSRLFLNDGSGVFDESSPWVNHDASVQPHVADMDLVDLDGDFDIDVLVTGPWSPARTYANNLYGGLGTSAFSDITQDALLAPGAAGSGVLNCASEAADVDGDGDLDLWMENHAGTADRVLRNDGPAAGGGYGFTRMDGWIAGDPLADENEAAFLDYDGDGDLDVFVANFSGTNWLYQSSLAQGIDPAVKGLFHRTGVPGGLAPRPELPSANNGGQSQDCEAADLDGDGDDDLLVANDANQQNYLFTNVLGARDSHAPVIRLITAQGDKPDGSATVLHAQVRDNASRALLAFYPARLVYRVNGGAPVSQPMTSQGGLQFRGVIPAQADATVSYHVEVTDLAGNTGASSTLAFVQGRLPAAWTDIAFGLAGSGGIPRLSGSGTLLPGTPGAVQLTGARPSTAAMLFVSLDSAPIPFKGGTLAAFPPQVTSALTTNSAGTISLPWSTWPAGLPSGTHLWFQIALADPGGPANAALSNALRAAVP
ncbi:MAG TPA: FG-GAP-like repeat-containing protein, partial [Planctomycetota bacterium]|nr:FG-GAP-like repeat-containing protein [Planctomycetota bacterium]